MHIGACRLQLYLPENHSLKEKRQVVRSVTARVKNKFNVAIAEVEDQDLWQMATLGITCVSSDPQHANEVLSKVIDFILGSRLDASLHDYEVEILRPF